MKIRFWGVRGTISTPYIDMIKTGGSTTCVEVTTDEKNVIILDAGTGLVALGRELMKEYKDKKMPKIHLFLTHTHWDHLNGFPFFAPLFCKNAEINLYAPAKKTRNLKDIILTQFDDDFSPITLGELPCVLNFFDIEEKTIDISKDLKITSQRHFHPGGAYGYRIEYKGKVFVFNTDVEHENGQIDQRVVDISKDADLMVHDAQYTEDQMKDRVGWGHSTWQQAVEVSRLAGVKQLGLTHHDPERTDKEVNALEKKAKKQFENSFFCRYGLEIEL